MAGGDRPPGTFVDSVVLLRRVLYELQRAPGANSMGPTQADIINYVSAQKWPSIVPDLDAAMVRLIDLRRAEAHGPKDRPSEQRFRLTHDGLVEEETVGEPGRRSIPSKVVDELRRPTMIAGFVYTVIGILIGYFLR